MREFGERILICIQSHKLKKKDSVNRDVANWDDVTKLEQTSFSMIFCYLCPVASRSSYWRSASVSVKTLIPVFLIRVRALLFSQRHPLRVSVSVLLIKERSTHRCYALLFLMNSLWFYNNQLYLLYTFCLLTYYHVDEITLKKKSVNQWCYALLFFNELFVILQ
jgi:hypothetical protein